MSVLHISKEDKRFLKLLFTPSWLSGLIIVLAGLTVSVGVIVTFSFSHSSLKQYLQSWEQSRIHKSVVDVNQSSATINPTLKNSWPLIFVWGLVGLFTYAVAASVVRFILETIEFRKEMNYVHANPRSMLIVTIEHIVMRLVAAILLGMLGFEFMNKILPYAVNAASVSATNLLSVQGIGYALKSFIVTSLSVYIATILLRLMFGRARLTSSV